MKMTLVLGSATVALVKGCTPVALRQDSAGPTREVPVAVLKRKQQSRCMCDLSMALWWVLSQAQSSKKTDFQEGLLRTCDGITLALSCRGAFSPFKFPNPNGPFLLLQTARVCCGACLFSFLWPHHGACRVLVDPGDWACALVGSMESSPLAHQELLYPVS